MLLRKLLQSPAVSSIFLQKRGSVISGPPSRILSMGERFIHFGIFIGSMMVTPILFMTNLDRIKGIEREPPKEEEQEEDEEEEEKEKKKE